MLISATDTVSPNSDDGGSGDHAVVLPVQRYVPSTGTAVHFGCRQAGSFFAHECVCVCVCLYQKHCCTKGASSGGGGCNNGCSCCNCKLINCRRCRCAHTKHTHTHALAEEQDHTADKCGRVGATLVLPVNRVIELARWHTNYHHY